MNNSTENIELSQEQLEIIKTLIGKMSHGIEQILENDFSSINEEDPALYDALVDLHDMWESLEIKDAYDMWLEDIVK